MAARKPLVVISGVIKELPSGDTLDATTSLWPIFKSSVGVGETLTIPSGYQSVFARQFSNDGTISNDGLLSVL